MAEEKLTTRLTLEGEREYRAALREITAEQKTNRSEMALLAAKYKDSANSAETLRAKLAVLEKQHEAQAKKLQETAKMLESARERQEHYTKAAADARVKMDTLAAAGDTQSAAYQEAAKSLAEAETRLGQVSAKIADYTQKTNYAEAALIQLDDEINRNKGYLDEAEQSADGCAKSIDEYGNSTKEAKDASSIFADVLSANVVDKGLSKVIEYAEMAGKALINLAQDSQQARSRLAEMTGAAGDDLEELYNATMGAYSKLPLELSFVTETAGELNTRLGLTGDALGKATEKVADFADMTHTDAITAVDGLSDVLAKWQMQGEDLIPTLDKILWATQYSGIGVGELTSALTANQAQLELYGYSLDTSIALFATMQREGVNVSSVMTGMRTAVDKLTASGEEAEPALRAAMEQIKSMPDASKAASAAIDIFGARAGTELARAIRSGKLEVDALVATVSGATGTLEKTAKASDTAKDKYLTALNAMRAETAPFAEELYELGLDVLPVVQSAVGWIGEHLPGVASSVVGLTAAIVTYKAAVSVATIANTAFGASLNATGIGLIVSAIAGLVTVISALALTMDDSTARAHELKDELDGVKTAATEADEALSTVATKTLYAAESAETYIDRLDALESKLGDAGTVASLTAAEQAEYNGAIEALSALLPDVGIQIDAQTGRIEGGTAALRDQIAAWKELAITQALQSELEAKTTAMMDSAAIASKTRAEIEEAYGSIDDARDKLVALDSLVKQKGIFSVDYNQELVPLKELIDTYDEAEASATQYANEIDTLSRSIPAMVAAMSSSSVDSVQAIIDAYSGIVPAIEQTVDDAEEPLNEGDERMRYHGNKAAEEYAAGLAEKQQRVIDAADALAESLAPAVESIKSMTSAMDGLSEAFAEQEANGRLSAATIVDIIEQGYAAALSVDTETGAVRLNAEAYMALATARLQAQIAEETETARQARARALTAEQSAAIEAAHANHDLAESYMEVYAAQIAEAEGHEAAVAALNELKGAIGSVPTGNWSSRQTSTPSRSASSSTKTTQTEDKYSAAKRRLDFLRSTDELTDAEYYDELERAATEYLEEKTDKWYSAIAEIYKGRKSIAAAEEKAAADELKAEYQQQLADIEYYRKLGIISEDEYYIELRRIRDTYCEENSTEWRKHTEALYKYTVATEKERLDELSDLYDEYIEARKAQIERERDMVVDAKNAEIDAINAEIAARKRAREDEDAEEAINARRRALAAAESELAYARTDEDRIQMEREVDRLRAELEDAIEDRDYELWERRQQTRIAEIQAEINDATAAADRQMASLSAQQASATEEIDRRAADYNKYLEALAKQAAEQIATQYTITTAPTMITNNTSSPTANVNVYTSELTGSILEERIKRVLEGLGR